MGCIKWQKLQTSHFNKIIPDYIKPLKPLNGKIHGGAEKSFIQCSISIKYNGKHGIALKTASVRGQIQKRRNRA